jgi:hypothetical protein
MHEGRHPSVFRRRRLVPRGGALDSVVAAHLPCGLVISLSLVVDAFVDGGGQGGAELRAIDVSHKVQSLGETLDPRTSRWWQSQHHTLHGGIV